MYKSPKNSFYIVSLVLELTVHTSLLQTCSKSSRCSTRTRTARSPVKSSALSCGRWDIGTPRQKSRKWSRRRTRTVTHDNHDRQLIFLAVHFLLRSSFLPLPLFLFRFSSFHLSPFHLNTPSSLSEHEEHNLMYKITTFWTTVFLFYLLLTWLLLFLCIVFFFLFFLWRGLKVSRVHPIRRGVYRVIVLGFTK